MFKAYVIATILLVYVGFDYVFFGTYMKDKIEVWFLAWAAVCVALTAFWVIYGIIAL